MRGLRVEVIHIARQSSQQYVETIRFSDDSRATPAYDVLEVSVQNGRARIDGSVTGITGSSFLTARWHITRIPHFVIYHSPYQLAGSDRSALAGLEDQRASFARKFGVRLPPVAAYYLYPTVGAMRSLTHATCGATSDNLGCAVPYASPPTIQAALWPTYHEPIHVYERALEPPPRGKIEYVAPLFIGEGTAVALEDREVDPRLSDYCSDLQYAPLDACASNALRNVQPLTLLQDSGFSAAVPAYAYSLGGSFVKDLILRHGYRAFGHFYYALAAQPSDRIRDYNVAAHAVYGTSIQQLLFQWTVDLKREHL